MRKNHNHEQKQHLRSKIKQFPMVLGPLYTPVSVCSGSVGCLQTFNGLFVPFGHCVCRGTRSLDVRSVAGQNCSEQCNMYSIRKEYPDPCVRSYSLTNRLCVHFITFNRHFIKQVSELKTVFSIALTGRQSFFHRNRCTVGMGRVSILY